MAEGAAAGPTARGAVSDADNLDQASELQDSLNNSSLAALRAKLAADAVPPPGFDGTCAACGEDIPKERLALGKYRCIHCQERFEKGLK